MKQFLKFIVVGGINTGIDFAILNVLMFSTNIYSGKWIIIFNSVSFATAVVNSYFMNKYWTFKKQKTQNTEVKSQSKEFFQFLIISIIGISLNDAAVYTVSTFIPPIFGLSEKLWANAAKLIATVVSMIWNFIGYKFIVFKNE
ncbi:GtrA family protein [Candidatus Wolfebacteria bacterium]|nr:GtrA family protein [Candidatus Wolfebacteria bacterium]